MSIEWCIPPVVAFPRIDFVPSTNINNKNTRNSLYHVVKWWVECHAVCMYQIQKLDCWKQSKIEQVHVCMYVATKIVFHISIIIIVYFCGCLLKSSGTCYNLKKFLSHGSLTSTVVLQRQVLG